MSCSFLHDFWRKIHNLLQKVNMKKTITLKDIVFLAAKYLINITLALSILLL